MTHQGIERETLRSWLTARFCFPLLLLSVLALGMYLGGRATREHWNGPRLHLNLALAWAPYVFALLVVVCYQRNRYARLPLWILGALWLLFFPNAPYLLTDWLYLPDLEGELWFNIALLTAFSVTGLLLAVMSLYLIQQVVRLIYGGLTSWIVAALALVLSGLGVYLGRFLRLNSWDVLLRPERTVKDILDRLPRHSTDDPNPLAFTLMFAGLVAVMYYVFLSIRRAPRTREEELW
jgi:uncharacterized membrane protein